MALNLYSKALALFGRIHRMEAAPVKHEAKWRSVNVVFEDVQHGEYTRGIRFGRFISGLLNCDLGGINADHREVLLREPDYVISSSTSNFQNLAGGYRHRGY